jgi:hypothetical protein
MRKRFSPLCTVRINNDRFIPVFEVYAKKKGDQKAALNLKLIKSVKT